MQESDVIRQFLNEHSSPCGFMGARVEAPNPGDGEPELKVRGDGEKGTALIITAEELAWEAGEDTEL